MGELSPRPTLESFVLFQAWNTQQLVLILLASPSLPVASKVTSLSTTYGNRLTGTTPEILMVP